MKHYKCVKDLQGEDFCVGMIKSANDWRDYLTKDLDRETHGLLIDSINKKSGKVLIKFIGNIWGLEFKEVKWDEKRNDFAIAVKTIRY